MPDYERYASNLVGTALFQGMDCEEIRALLEAMAPPVHDGRANPDDGPIRSFQLVASCSPSRGRQTRMFPYSSDGFCEVGMIMGEIPALSLKDDYLKRTPLSVKKPQPSFDWNIECLDLTPEMICADYGPKISPTQLKMIRNLMGMLAQKVVDVRRELYLERSGWDMYAPENRVKDGLSDGGAVRE